ncbi:MAG: hypothetical protein SPE59_03485 [Treponema sp.]|nr:hypothetical protein [Treponema sp.]
MKAVLLSIKPEFAHKIFDGTKKYEFRKQIFKDSSVKKVIVYSSSPEQKVIGEFKIDTILSDTPSAIWLQTRDYSGISQAFYDEYFRGRQNAYAIKIASTRIYEQKKDLSDFDIMFPPQSFAYVEV